MKKIRPYLLFLGVLLILSSSVVAQGSSWLAWLYNQETGWMVKVDNAGTAIESFVLPTLIGHSRYSENVQVSHNGNYVAYTVYNPDMLVSQFLVYDTVNDMWRVTYSPGQLFYDTIDLSSGSRIFNTFDTAVAYAYNKFDEGWTIVVIDLTTGIELFQLTSNDPNVVALGIDSFLTPVVQKYSDATVHFTMVAAGSEGGLIYDNYEWDLLSNNVTPSIIYANFINDEFPQTGEVVMAMFDERLPNQIDMLPMPIQFNALAAYDPRTGARFPFYSSETWSFGSPKFIQSGELVLSSAFDNNSSTLLYPVVRRDGGFAGYAPIEPNRFDSIRGTYEGFIYTAQTAADQTLLRSVNSRVGLSTGAIVWSAPAGTSPRLVWVRDVPVPVESGPFTPWRQLAAPLVRGSGLLAPGDIPTPTPLAGNNALSLRVGGLATINTTEGDLLNIRSGPGVSYARVARVPNGTRVVILEGPREGEGYRWWRIQLPDGAEGWAVDRADDVPTLIPSG